MKHTPGPWEISERDYGDELWFGGEGCGLICVNGWANGGVKDQPGLWARMLADARLIAAAPDLLAIVQELQESASYWSAYDVPLGIVARVNSVIAKATGEIE